MSTALSLKYTGERLIPDQFMVTDRLLQEHLDRYRWAARMIAKDHAEQRARPEAGLADQGYAVLDAPCGVGYGAWLMANHLGMPVTGWDKDPETIMYARARYAVEPDLTQPFDFSKTGFEIVDLEYRPDVRAVYDYITCFEGIEHVSNPSFVAKQLCDLLRNNGMIFVSTPRVHGPGSGSEFHTHEMTKDELTELFAPHLSSVELLGQEMRVGDCVPDDNARFYVLVGRK